MPCPAREHILKDLHLENNALTRDLQVFDGDYLELVYGLFKTADLSNLSQESSSKFLHVMLKFGFNTVTRFAMIDVSSVAANQRKLGAIWDVSYFFLCPKYIFYSPLFLCYFVLLL